MALCPKCDAPIHHARLENMTINAPEEQFVGVSYSCPVCHHILSVSIDPIAIKADIVDEIVERLRG
jgi:hypothetical protein